MTLAAIDFDGRRVDRVANAAFDQHACLRTAATNGRVAATASTAVLAIGFAYEAADAAGDLRAVTIDGTCLAIAQTTITPNTHDILGPTTTAGKIADVASGIYCAYPLIDEAAAADDLFTVRIMLGSF